MNEWTIIGYYLYTWEPYKPNKIFFFAPISLLLFFCFVLIIIINEVEIAKKPTKSGISHFFLLLPGFIGYHHHHHHRLLFIDRGKYGNYFCYDKHTHTHTHSERVIERKTEMNNFIAYCEFNYRWFFFLFLQLWISLPKTLPHTNNKRNRRIQIRSEKRKGIESSESLFLPFWFDLWFFFFIICFSAIKKNSFNFFIREMFHNKSRRRRRNHQFSTTTTTTICQHVRFLCVCVCCVDVSIQEFSIFSSSSSFAFSDSIIICRSWFWDSEISRIDNRPGITKKKKKIPNIIIITILSTILTSSSFKIK